MKSSKLFLALLATIFVLHALAAQAAGIDMDDPHRALGREDDIRVDAQLIRDTVSPGMPIGVICQIQNLSTQSVAVATRVASAAYDEDTRTVTLAVGSEIPPAGPLPQLTVIAPGEKRVFRVAASPAYPASAMRSTAAVGPRYVQVKVAILRDLEPFRALLDAQESAQAAARRASLRLNDEQFNQWFEANDTIFLNSIPVRFEKGRPTGAETESRGSF
jgi:hypothetical protein